MDSNLTSCDRCGHISSQGAKVCAYCGADFSDSGDAGSNGPGSTVTELNPATTAAETPVISTTESAGLQETTEPIPPVPEPDEDNHLDESRPGIEIPETPEITVAEQAAAVEGEALQEEPIIEALQRVDDSATGPVDISAALTPDSSGDQEKLVFDLPAETAVVDLFPEDELETAAAVTAPESEQGTFKPADDGSTVLEKTVMAADAPPDVISLVRELAASSQPGPATDESETELEISIEPIQEEPKLEELADDVKSEQLEDAIVLLPEDEIDPLESDSKDSVWDSMSAIAGQNTPKSVETGEEVVEKVGPALPPDRTQESGALSEPVSKVPVELDASPESVSDSKKAVSKAQIIALKKRKLAKIAALKKKKIALAKAKALEKKKAALAKAQSSIKGAAAAIAPHPAPGHRIAGLLEKYKGQTIGINYDNLAGIAEADLIEVHDAYFSVVAKDNKFQYSFPIKTILSIMEGEEGVEIGESDEKSKFVAVVKVFPVVLF